jgi:hypothetical protein
MGRIGDSVQQRRLFDPLEGRSNAGFAALNPR